MNIRFVTIFPQAQDVHLRKEVGQIPNALAQKFGYKSIFVCFPNDAQYPSLATRASSLEIQFLKYPFKQYPLLATLFYLLRYARKIDVLNIYGQSRWSFFVGCFYKIMHPSGVLFLKLDMNIQYLESLQTSPNVKRHLYWWNYYFKSIVDIVSSEYLSLTAALKSFYKIESDKIVQLPNGVDLQAISKLRFKRKNWHEKENLVLIVGRIGAPEKGHELFLEFLPKINFSGFKFVFVGPIEIAFQEKIDDFFIQNEHLKSGVTFVGNVADFTILSEWYNRAKIFCITSFREGFPIVIPESMYWGNYIVSMNVSSISEILENGHLGTIITDRSHYANVLETLLENEAKLEIKAKLSTEKAERFYDWSKLVMPLNDLIKKARN